MVAFYYNTSSMIVTLAYLHRGLRTRELILVKFQGHMMLVGYHVIEIDGRTYQVSRLIWIMMTGSDPLDKSIDHIDGDKHNNRWVNLRLVEHYQNMMNKKRRKRKGIQLPTGVHSTQNGKFAAIGCIKNCKTRWLGTFETVEEAHKAYLEHTIETYGTDFISEHKKSCGIAISV